MSFNDLDYDELTRTLTDNFNILADEVQLLSDRKTVLEHKLRFAHEQYQYLADKYAPADSEIASTLAKLQLPPDLQVSVPDRVGFVPLPGRGRSISKQEAAVAIRDGRRAAQRLAGIKGSTTGSTASGARSISGSSNNMRFSARPTSLSTVLEQDFTVLGKKSSLLCPFAKPAMNRKDSHGASTLESDRPLTPPDAKDPKPHGPTDPICAAMYTETMNSPPPSQSGSAAKCPIRYLDQHSPEEVARYFETHKHEIPRSHEVCVKRYQRNEDDIRKLDAKYGNLVSMIQGLGQKHQPMLPADEEELNKMDEELDRTSIEMVENWAKAVSADGVGQDDAAPEEEYDRESRFDRPMKEIRVGESPSRPWGISVPIFDQPLEERPASPPPAPVSSEHMPKPVGKCPFGGQQAEVKVLPAPAQTQGTTRPTGTCPFAHGQAKLEQAPDSPLTRTAAEETAFPAGRCPFGHDQKANERPAPLNVETPSKVEATPIVHTQPAFINPLDVAEMGANGPNMIFTGPVFIGYPMEQALAFMQQYRGSQ
ncbi:hypothetical protein D0Z07_2588 [Hyphodiscus hymeniophilus]|uniref:Uncharacterized protein n=1 Tax=Hyphodiscus hymeniophilus TaxID=353542 RepID=A0A9P6VMU0_9HELO|nr:hypothetical protein D0Z07_2588 [Hyphodiscus hymeniophilus]